METVSDLFTPQTLVQFNTATNFMCFKKEKKDEIKNQNKSKCHYQPIANIRNIFINGPTDYQPTVYCAALGSFNVQTYTVEL